MKQENRLAVAYCINDRYFEPMIVSITALLENVSPDYVVHIYVVYSDLDEEKREKMGQLLSRYSNKEIHFVPLKAKSNLKFFNIENQLARLKSSSFSNYFNYFDKTIYYRLVLEEYIPEERLIYLDADTLPVGDISTLWEYPLNGNRIGAVADSPSDSDPSGLRYNQFIDLNLESYYVNSGVLLLDLALIRKTEPLKQVKDELKRLQQQELLFPDQDILNVLHRDSLTLLPPGFNCAVVAGGHVPSIANLLRYGYFTGRENPYSQQQVTDALNAPTIIHFLGKQKPWHVPGKYALHKEKYWYYYNLTPMKTKITADIEEDLKVASKEHMKLLAEKLQARQNSAQNEGAVTRSPAFA